MAMDDRNHIAIVTTGPGNYLTAEISASAVESNLALLRSMLRADTKICAVVKADCYGHGLTLLLDVLSKNTDCLAVTTAQEALHLRQCGYSGPMLMFFSPCAYRGETELMEVLEELIVHDVALTLVSPFDVASVAAAAQKANACAKVHVKIDTGMNRSGIPIPHAAELVERIRGEKSLRMTGLYTHFACADEDDKTSALNQLELFHSTAKTLGRCEGLILHTANSAATIDMPQSHLDMVRPGLAVYGYQCSDRMHNHPALKPALRLTGRLMQLKDVGKSERCGYGLTYTFNRPSRIGLVPIGYGDGYLRSFSNRATMRIAGCDAAVRGRISMDQTIIDLTDVPQAAVGDEVEIISPDPSAPNSVENLARLAGTIPYEITCLLGNRVRRIPANW